jgi:hypothetical protein
VASKACENISGCELSLDELDAIAGGFLGIHINFKKALHDVGKALGGAVKWIEHQPKDAVNIAASIIAVAEA